MRILFGTASLALLAGLCIAALADEGETVPAGVPAPPTPHAQPDRPAQPARTAQPTQPAEPAQTAWERTARHFDLDGDGTITWEEYQKVVTGFAALDSNRDGVITAEDVRQPPMHPPGPEGMRPPMHPPGPEGMRPPMHRPGPEGMRPPMHRPGPEGMRPPMHRPGPEGMRPPMHLPGPEGMQPPMHPGQRRPPGGPASR